MADVLPVAALKFGNPVPLAILTKADDTPFHTRRFPRMSNGMQISCKHYMVHARIILRFHSRSIGGRHLRGAPRLCGLSAAFAAR